MQNLQWYKQLRLIVLNIGLKHDLDLHSMWVFTGIDNLAYIHRQKRCLHRDQENMSQFSFVVSSYEGLFKITKIKQDMNFGFFFIRLS